MSNITPSASDADTDRLNLDEIAGAAPVFDDGTDSVADEPEPAPAVVGASSRRSRVSAVPVVRASAALAILVAMVVATWYASGAGSRYVVTTSPAALTQGPQPGAGAPTQPKPGAPSSIPKATGPVPAASVPIGNSPTGPAGPAPAPGGTVPIGTAPAGTAGPGPSVAIDPNTSGPLAGLSAEPLTGQARCPLGWPKPERSGGLASMILLAPAAGPFSSEAFALGSVYQPLMQLVGPVLAEIEPVIDANISWINPIIKQVQAAEAVVLEAILPFYGPYRAQFLAAEGNLAKALAPALTRIYQSPQAACLVAWQGQIISAAKGKRITTASLTRPGQVNTYG